MSSLDRLRGYRPSRLAIAATFLALMTLTGTLMVLDSVFGGRVRAASPTQDCGLSDCAAAAIPTAAETPTSEPRALHTPAAGSTATPTPKTTARPLPSPPQTARVLVTYTGGNGGGSYLITNRGSAALPTWRLSFTFPHGHVTSVWPGSWNGSGKTVIVSGGSIPPGGNMTIHFQAKGPDRSPEGCTLNGSSCTSK